MLDNHVVFHWCNSDVRHVRCGSLHPAVTTDRRSPGSTRNGRPSVADGAGSGDPRTAGNNSLTCELLLSLYRCKDALLSIKSPFSPFRSASLTEQDGYFVRQRTSQAFQADPLSPFALKQGRSVSLERLTHVNPRCMIWLRLRRDGKPISCPIHRPLNRFSRFWDTPS
jgi:hypothetical protein